MKLKEKIWINENMTKALKDGDPNGKYVLGHEGQEIEDHICKRFNIIDGKVSE